MMHHPRAEATNRTSITMHSIDLKIDGREGGANLKINGNSSEALSYEPMKKP